MNAQIEIGTPGDKVIQSGLDNPDKLTESPNGKLIIIKDNKPSDIWFAGKDFNGDRAADNVWLLKGDNMSAICS